MPKAVWNGRTVADSDETRLVQGSHYFPPDSIDRRYFRASPTRSVCPWRGEASYLTIEVDGEVNEDAAWFYPNPKDAAREIKDHVAFWRGVQIEP